MFSITVTNILPPLSYTPEDKFVRSHLYYRSERTKRVELTKEEVDAAYKRHSDRVMQKGPWKGTLSGPWYDDSDIEVYGFTEDEVRQKLIEHLVEMKDAISAFLATLTLIPTPTTVP